ncbi:MAG: Rv2175c family DNA-binding protein [Beutenbergiaceae bacterium]
MNSDDLAIRELVGDWLSIPEAAVRLGVRDRDVRSMISDQALLAVRLDDRAPQIPAAFLVADPVTGAVTVLAGLRGTVIQLADAGYSDTEMVRWLFQPNDELADTPVQALINLRTHAVRRAGQALAF